ncbi:MAG: secretin N-terminal domain-containing protein, partial [Planctomycetota bacterium]
MTPQRRRTLRILPALALTFCAGGATPLLAQNADPDDPRDERGRRVTDGLTTKLAFNNVSVDDVVPFIVETTGKVVMPSTSVTSQRITIVNDADLPQAIALDHLFSALFQAGVAIVETEDVVRLDVLDEINRMDLPVIGVDESTLARTDSGVIAEKVFRLTHASAEDVAELVEDGVPSFAIVGFNEQSNTLVVAANIGTIQRVEMLVNGIDQPSATSLGSRTFRLRYADAEDIAQNILDLYEDDGSGAAAAQQQAAARFFSRGGRGGGEAAESAGAGPSENLRVTANVQQNAVTVVAETEILDEIATLIDTEWDVETRIDTVLPRIYTLRHRDPVRVQALLEGQFGEASASEDGGTTSSATRLAGQFSFSSDADSGQLIVIAKSPDNLAVIDEIIAELDQPQTIGLPELIELKHANAEELAEQLNALLSERGTLAQLPRQESGLDGGGTSVSPFASQDAQADTAGDDETELITFWWQNGQDPGDARPSSSLIGRIRIVPVWRQNAVLVTAPPEFRSSVGDLVRQLDQPGRQVLLKAVVAEIS